MSDISEGTRFDVTDALGRTFRKRALSGVDEAGAYPVVWACSEEEWDDANAHGRTADPEPFPWPLTSIQVLAL